MFLGLFWRVNPCGLRVGVAGVRVRVGLGYPRVTRAIPYFQAAVKVINSRFFIHSITPIFVTSSCAPNFCKVITESFFQTSSMGHGPKIKPFPNFVRTCRYQWHYSTPVSQEPSNVPHLRPLPLLPPPWATGSTGKRYAATWYLHLSHNLTITFKLEKAKIIGVNVQRETRIL